MDCWARTYAQVPFVIFGIKAIVYSYVDSLPHDRFLTNGPMTFRSSSLKHSKLSIFRQHPIETLDEKAFMQLYKYKVNATNTAIWTPDNPIIPGIITDHKPLHNAMYVAFPFHRNGLFDEKRISLWSNDTVIRYGANAIIEDQASIVNYNWNTLSIQCECDGEYQWWVSLPERAIHALKVAVETGAELNRFVVKLCSFPLRLTDIEKEESCLASVVKSLNYRQDSFAMTGVEWSGVLWFDDDWLEHLEWYI